MLREKGKTLAVAEALSGGLVSHRLTNVPGASAYFQGNIIAYSDQVKVSLLGVREETLHHHGAASEETVQEMAIGVRERLASDIGIAITGIAGPDGGTPDTPVGTACLALTAADTTVSRRYQLWGNREWIKTLTSQLLLDWVRRYLLGLPIAESGFIRR